MPVDQYSSKSSPDDIINGIAAICIDHPSCFRKSIKDHVIRYAKPNGVCHLHDIHRIIRAAFPNQTDSPIYHIQIGVLCCDKALALLDKRLWQDLEIIHVITAQKG